MQWRNTFETVTKDVEDLWFQDVHMRKVWEVQFSDVKTYTQGAKQ